LACWYHCTKYRAVADISNASGGIDGFLPPSPLQKLYTEKQCITNSNGTYTNLGEIRYTHCPTVRSYDVVDRLVKLHKEWKFLREGTNRKGVSQLAKETDFSRRLNRIFNISKRDVQKLVRNPVDLAISINHLESVKVPYDLYQTETLIMVPSPVFFLNSMMLSKIGQTQI